MSKTYNPAIRNGKVEKEMKQEQDFNPIFIVGNKVKMVNCGEADHYGEKVWICRSDSYLFPYGKKEEVVFLEGKAGCFLCDFLELVK